MKSSVLKGFLGGFVGTTIITLMVSFGSPDLTGGPSDLTALLAGMLGVSWIGGLWVHFLIGTVVLPMIYVLFLNRVLAGGAAVRGMAWGLLLWLVSQALVIPAAGGGFFSANAGGLKAVLDSLIGHLVYGLTLGVFAGAPRSGSYLARRAYGLAPHARHVG